MAGSTLIAIPVIIFFLLVQGRMVVGPDRRGGEGMTDLRPRSRCGCCCPAFAGTTLAARRAPRLLEEGLGGVCLFGSNTADGPDAVAALTAPCAPCRPDAVVAVDEEGGDVTRLHARDGSPVLGAAALGAVDDLELTRATGRGDRRRARRASASTSTSARSPT